MNKIIQIRGTSGSGKSHLIRRVMAKYSTKVPHHIPGRKQPFYYELRNAWPGKPLFIVGHYETPCGGSDTISNGTDVIYDLVRTLAQEGNVLFEGLLISIEVTRTATLVNHGELHVIQLATPLEDCIASIKQRRLARGVDKPFNEGNAESKHKGTKTSLVRLAKASPDILTYTLDREAAYAKVVELLEV